MEVSLDDPYPEHLFFILTDVFSSFDLFYGIVAAVIILLLFCSAMISGSEVAFFSLSADEVSECRSSNKSAEQHIVKLLDKPKNLLATVLILNNLVNVAIVTISTYATWRYFGKSTEGLVVVVLTAVITVTILFFGEILPKQYAIHHSLAFSKKTAAILNYASSFFKPFAALLMSLSSVVEKRLEKKGYNVSVDELNHALEMTTSSETTTAEEKGILKGIVNFGTLSVKQVMRSRLEITAIDIEMDFHDLMDRINKCGYSRIPIYRETIDSIEGILYVKDLLPYLDHEESFEWQKLLHKGFFVPESKKIDTLLKEFQDKRVHMAIVVDEYGGTSGLITLEDIIEEIVGEINDEFDDNDVHYNKLDDNTYIFEGRTSLNDFCKIIDEDSVLFESVKGESESLGGLLLEIHSKLPRAGEKIYFDSYVFTVVAVDNKRIKRIRVFKKISATTTQQNTNINTSVNRQ
ncbi:gliding motility-associated protein GldE [Catalinimonas niigatensis]|uniref:gliding motility-associated protein GldE n=1 Tax=Catalinimonas niigatensis TaxID=1397264 RepID=UPI002666A80A|nr:gliding motility-associated protein GldE [Catalinimonas niigatensis]WPP53497.1 gliding motility-associated protein GldE [Catalinimonas niigatensis]